MKLLRSKKLATGIVLAIAVASSTAYAACVEPAWCFFIGSSSPVCQCANV